LSWCAGLARTLAAEHVEPDDQISA